MFSSQNSQVSSDANYIEDVFSTYLYTGNGSTQTITNGIDLAGEGGLVWYKDRTTAYEHQLVDTVRGAGYNLETPNSSAQASRPTALTAFTSTGFTLGSNAAANGSGDNFVSWTFRKQPKFFDVVTFTATSSNDQRIAHLLGSVPGCIMLKGVDVSSDWFVYHRSVNAPDARQYVTYLNSTVASQFGYGGDIWGASDPTSTDFGFKSGVHLTAGKQYVAYLFAHNAGGFGLTGTDNVISCGSFTTDSSGNFTTTLGYEPQWILYKNSGAASHWNLIDTMRGWPVGAGSSYLRPNTSGVETTDSLPYMIPTATGFAGINSGSGNTQTYIYIAIRRGPMKVPTDATKVFAPVLQTGNGTGASITTAGFAPDSAWVAGRNGANYKSTSDKLIGTNRFLQTVSTAAEVELTSPGTQGILSWDMKGVTYNGYSLYSGNGNLFAYYLFGRAPSFFDEVCYTGTGSARTISHNLGAIPELMIFKRRSAISNWDVYCPLTSTLQTATLLNSNDVGDTQSYASSGIFTGQPTSSGISLAGNSLNNSGTTYVAYLFATCAGVSKCTAFTGTGTLQTINCGFTAGSRFVLIKRTDAAGDWYVWDSSRGLSSSTDPYLLLNSTAAEVTSTNWVDTTSTGFQVTAASGNNVNINGASYIALAIA